MKAPPLVDLLTLDIERHSDPRDATRGASTHTNRARRSPPHTVYMSTDSIAKALTDPPNEPEEVIAIVAAA